MMQVAAWIPHDSMGLCEKVVCKILLVRSSIGHGVLIDNSTVIRRSSGRMTNT